MAINKTVPVAMQRILFFIHRNHTYITHSHLFSVLWKPDIIKKTRNLYLFSNICSKNRVQRWSVSLLPLTPIYLSPCSEFHPFISSRGSANQNRRKTNKDKATFFLKYYTILNSWSCRLESHF